MFLSRSGRDAKVEDFCRELEFLGCGVQVFQGSVANIDDVKRVVAEAAKPIRGVVQLSMAPQDRALNTMTYDDWYTAVRPKVDGTWNLHHALERSPLDFFVMFASTSSITSQYGQSNYAAATFSHPGQISVGVLSYMPLAGPNNRIIWKRNRRFAVYRNIEAASQKASAGSDEGPLKASLSGPSASTSPQDKESIDFLAGEIGKTLYGFMMKDPVDMQVDQPLASLGLDSLLAIELRNWCKTDRLRY